MRFSNRVLISVLVLSLTGTAACANGTTMVSAQSQDYLAERRKEADRLREQGYSQLPQTLNFLLLPSQQVFDINQLQSASQSWETALTIYKEIGDRLQESNVLCSLGIVNFFMDRTQLAIQQFERSLQISQELDPHNPRVISTKGCIFTSLSNLYKELGQHEQSEEYNRRLLELTPLPIEN